MRDAASTEPPIVIGGELLEHYETALAKAEASTEPPIVIGGEIGRRQPAHTPSAASTEPPIVIGGEKRGTPR